MQETRILLLLFTCLTLLVSCKTDDNSSDVNEQAYQDYKNFVIQVEGDTTVNESDLGAAWESKTDSLMQESERHKKGMVDHLEAYEAERREEVNAFDERLHVAFEERQRKHDEVSYRYQLRREMLNMEVSEDDMTAINASNIANIYEHFVSTLKDKLPGFTTKDWQFAEGWWSALGNRKREINDEISQADQRRIEKHQEAYKQIRKETL